MTVTRNSVRMKHFAGIERFSEHVYANVYCKANSTNAAKFLRELIENAPYKIRSIHVGRGSEFMKGYYPKDFEEVCRELGLTLFVPSYKTNIQQQRKFSEELSEDTIVGTHCVGAHENL